MRGLANASLFTFFDIGGIFGPTLAGIAAENMPIPSVFKIASLILLVGLIATTRLNLTDPPTNQETPEDR
jgi:MFS family permease